MNSKDLFAGMEQGPMCFYAPEFFDLQKLPVDSQGGITVYAGNDETGEWTGGFGSQVDCYLDSVIN